MENARYERLLEDLNIPRFKINMRLYCSVCTKRMECPTYLLWRYLEENFPNGYSYKQFLTVPEELKPGLENYKEKISLTDWFDL